MRAKMLIRAGLALGAIAAVVGPSANASAAPSYIGDQWGLTQINAPQAWQYGTGAGVTIGVVDTGVDLTQQDLQGKVVASTTILSSPSSGCADASQDPNGQDDFGHGTHVSGIAAASGQYGVSGAAPSARLVVAKVLDCTGSGTEGDVAAGIAWVVQHGAKVVNLSLGGDPGFEGVNCLIGGCSSSTLNTAIEDAWNAGAIPVVAAGNSSGNLFGSGGYGNLDAVVVAATGPSGQFASDYSSTPGSAKWGVLAPGGDDTANGQSNPSTPTCGQYDPAEILSTYWTSANPTSCYATDEGTSMATPFVAGTLALLLGRGLSQQQAVQVLLSTLNKSVNCGSGGGCQGLVNAGAAMAEAAALTPSPVVSGPAHSPATTTTRATSHPAVAAAGSTTTAPTTTTSSSTSTSSPKVRAASAQHKGGTGHGSVLWLVIPILLGVAVLAALAWLFTRDREGHFAMVQEPNDGSPTIGEPPPPDISNGI